MKLSDYSTYKENPFIIEGVASKSVIKKGEVVEMANTESGELTVYQKLSTEVTFNKDSLQFTKLFNGAINDIKNFSSPALKLWCYILENIAINGDEVYIDLKDCMEYTSYESKSAVYKGLCELIEKKFIARKVGTGTYFINPNKFFNGKRA